MRKQEKTNEEKENKVINLKNKEVEKKETLDYDQTLEFAEQELKYTIEVIDQELETIEKKMEETGKISFPAYQAKVGLIGHRLDAVKTLSKLAMDKKKMEKQVDGSLANDITSLLVEGK